MQHYDEAPSFIVEQVPVTDRTSGIGGSDVAALVNMDPYRTAFDVWEEKRGRQPAAPPPAAQRWLDRGRRLEPVIREMYTEQAGEGVKVTHAPNVLYRSAQCPWMVAHLDGVIDDVAASGPGLLECKHASLALFATIKRDGLPYHWLLQVQHYLYVTGWTWADVAVLNSERWELLTVRVTADDAVQQALLTIEASFWHANVLGGVEPPAFIAVAEQALPATTSAVQTIDTPAFANAVRLWLDAKETEDAAAALRDSARVEMLAAIGNHLGVYEGAGVRVYYTKTVRGGRFDKDALRRLGAIDPLALQTWAQGKNLDLPQLEQVMLDLTQFEQPPVEYEQLRVYPLPSKEGT